MVLWGAQTLDQLVRSFIFNRFNDLLHSRLGSPLSYPLNIESKRIPLLVVDLP